MKLDKAKLRRIIIESIDEDMQNKMKVKSEMLSTFDRSFVAQAYELCDVMGYDFAQLVREMLGEHLESVRFMNHVSGFVSPLLAIFHANKQDNFYIDDENLESDISMEFFYKTVNDITSNIEDYYVKLFVAIGQGK